MAERPRGYGMTAELTAKKDAKYDQELAGQALQWIQGKLRGAGASRASSINPSASDSNSAHEQLKDGVALMQLAAALNLNPGKVNESKMAFKQMENIGNFLTSCEKMGVKKTDLFQTVDLYEAGNMPQVINGIFALGRKVGDIGPKEAAENKREFSEDQLKAGQNVIGLQMGSNKGASQAGQSFGKPRHIID